MQRSWSLKTVPSSGSFCMARTGHALTQAGFSEDGGRLWYYDGAEYFAVPEGYAVGQDGRAYDANGKVYAAGWESPVYDPGTDWGPDWDQSWD